MHLNLYRLFGKEGSILTRVTVYINSETRWNISGIIENNYWLSLEESSHKIFSRLAKKQPSKSHFLIREA